ncbi:hypothetical protein LINPERHAP1_LOCUS17089 [Linum perenne]
MHIIKKIKIIKYIKQQELIKIIKKYYCYRKWRRRLYFRTLKTCF